MKSLVKLIIAVVIVIGLPFVTGCEKQGPVSALEQIQNQAMSETIIQTDRGPVRVLQVDAEYIRSKSLSKKIESDTIFYIEEFMAADHDGELEIRGGQYGKSKLKIKSHSLPADMTVYMQWPDGSIFEGEIGSLEFGTNVILSEPAELELTYKRANLAGISESNLALFIYNEITNQWDNLNADFDLGHGKIELDLDRFGKLAMFEVKNGELKEVYRLDANAHFAKKFIKANKGGKVEVGDKNSGKSKLEFKKHSLPYDVTIDFEWAPANTLMGMLNNLEFGPHGLQFNIPVECELSYKMADLTGIQEGSLQIYYYNDVSGIWELIGGTVDTNKKTVTAFLHHFSRYAIGAE